PEGEEAWEEYRRSRYSRAWAASVETALEASNVFDVLPLLCFYESNFSSERELIHGDIRERFQRPYDILLGRFLAMGGQLEEVQQLETFLRGQWLRRGIDIVCRKGNAEDLAIVRETVEYESLTYSGLEIGFLRRYGTWEDVNLIVRVCERPTEAVPSLLFGVAGGVNRYLEGSEAICVLARGRINDVLGLDLPTQLKRGVLASVSAREFVSLEDEILLEFLRSDDTEIRKTTALRIVETLTKSRQAKLLRDYLSAEQSYFYNVVYWLDVGASL